MDICQTGNGFNGMVNKSVKSGNKAAIALKKAGVNPRNISASERQVLNNSIKLVDERDKITNTINNLPDDQRSAAYAQSRDKYREATEAVKKAETIAASVDIDRSVARMEELQQEIVNIANKYR